VGSYLVCLLVVFIKDGTKFVLVQRRATALAIADLLRTSADHMGFLRFHVVVGHGSFADPQLQVRIIDQI
jgi:hypothetical protein